MSNLANRIYPSLSMTFNPEVWNGKRRPYSNCYTYALNATDHSFLDVGGLGTHGINDPKRGFDTDQYSSADGLRKLLITDGLIPVANATFHPRRDHIIAAFGVKIGYLHVNSRPLMTLSAFHIMRLDQDGTMSEKSGDSPVNNISQHGKPIKPEDCFDDFKLSILNSIEEANKRNRLLQGRPEQMVFAGFFKVPECGLAFKVGQ